MVESASPIQSPWMTSFAGIPTSRFGSTAQSDRVLKREGIPKAPLPAGDRRATRIVTSAGTPTFPIEKIILDDREDPQSLRPRRRSRAPQILGLWLRRSSSLSPVSETSWIRRRRYPAKPRAARRTLVRRSLVARAINRSMGPSVERAANHTPSQFSRIFYLSQR